MCASKVHERSNGVSIGKDPDPCMADEYVPDIGGSLQLLLVTYSDQAERIMHVDWRALDSRLRRHDEVLRSLFYNSGRERTLRQASKLGGMIRRSAVVNKLVSVRGNMAFLDSVVVPEFAVRLVMEDLAVDQVEARRILEDSREVGELLNEDHDDCGRGPQTAEHLFYQCKDPRSKPLRDMGLNTKEQVWEAFGNPKLVKKLAQGLIPSGWLQENRLADKLHFEETLEAARVGVAKRPPRERHKKRRACRPLAP
ncbi:hypothetical protein MKZ38_006992 [Zalerion maritima]|uniref:Restriction of telomere capping protein 4 n=1 Tax=Zalerion maritima TaxID=339359 RepID=A0AAD5WPG7_9PEZI|nr:hypothetical protein MKZ38_006992 [Zalerion maritima]